MPIDPKGTEPGLATPAETPKPELMMACANGCGGKKAVEVGAQQPGQTNRIYQCVGCKKTWSVPVGAGIVL